MILTKGKRTKKKLLDAAARLFAEKGFYNVSVNDICCSLGLSVGAAYKYFKSKQEILSTIADELLKEISQEIKNAELVSESVKVRHICRLIEKKLHEKKHYIISLREFEYSSDSDIRRFYSELEKEISQIIYRFPDEKKSLDLNSWLIASLTSFLVSEEEIFGNEPKSDYISEIIEKGILKEKIIEDYFNINTKMVEKEKYSYLSQKCEEIFGKYGYENTKIYLITEAAGYSVGSFYLHFRSKLDAYRDTVIRLRDELIKKAYIFSKDAKTRGEVEVKSFLALFEFTREHPYGYKIIMSSKFIDRELYNKYYKYIYENYRKQLSKKHNISSFTVDNPSVSAALMMAAGHSIALRKIVWNDLAMNEKEVIRYLLNKN